MLGLQDLSLVRSGFVPSADARSCSPAHARSDWKHGLHRLQCLALRPVQLDIEPNRSAMWNRLDDKLRAIVEKKKPSA